MHTASARSSPVLRERRDSSDLYRRGSRLMKTRTAEATFLRFEPLTEEAVTELHGRLERLQDPATALRILHNAVPDGERFVSARGVLIQLGRDRFVLRVEAAT